MNSPMQSDYRRRLEAAEARVQELEVRHKQATEAATAKLDAVIAEATATYMAERAHGQEMQKLRDAAEAEERNDRTLPESRRRYRLDPATRLLAAVFEETT